MTVIVDFIGILKWWNIGGSSKGMAVETHVNMIVTWRRNTVSWQQSFWLTAADVSTLHSIRLIPTESISRMSGFFLNWLMFWVID